MNKILIVEDDEVLRESLKELLEIEKHTVLIAENGKEALNILKNETPSLILLDVLMPKLSGIEVLEDIKKNDTTKNIPVIVLTNLGHESDKQKMLDLGADDYYVKAENPPTEILEKIKKYL